MSRASGPRQRRLIGRAAREAHLVQVREQALLVPSFRLPAIKVNSLGSGIHHKVYRASATQNPPTWHDCLAAIEMLAFLGLVEEGGLRVRSQMSEVDGWVNNSRIIQVVLSTYQDPSRGYFGSGAGIHLAAFHQQD